jgi:hypothetical protein
VYVCVLRDYWKKLRLWGGTGEDNPEEGGISQTTVKFRNMNS